MASPNPGQQSISTITATMRMPVIQPDSQLFAEAAMSDIAAYMNSVPQVLASLCATGGLPPAASTSGTDATPSVTETYLAAVTMPGAGTITGVALFNGSAAAGNVTAYLTSVTGALLASTASTAQSGTDAFQRIAFATPYASLKPQTFFVLVQFNNTSARFNAHPFGNFPAGKLTSTVYGTFPTGFTVPTTFTANLGPMGGLY